jgi:uncharacterized delta-60 repeat protein
MRCATRPARLHLQALEPRDVPTAGNLDPTFSGDGLAYVSVAPFEIDTASGVAVQADDKVVLAGTANGYTNSSAPLLARLNADGTPDASFSGDGIATLPGTTAVGGFSQVIQQPDGKLVAIGTASVSGNNRLLLARFNPDGSLDANFAAGGVYVGSSPGEIGTTVTLDANDKIVVAGSTPGTNYGSQFLFARFNTDGSLDTSFNSTGEVVVNLGLTDAQAQSVIVQTDGKIVAAGHTSTSSGNFSFVVVRVNADGALDTGFNGTGVARTAPPNTSFQGIGQIAELPDGRLVAGGTCGVGGSYMSTPTLLRYNADGTLDTSLAGTGYVLTTLNNGAGVNGIAVQPNGQVVAAGVVAIPGGSNAIALRYNTDGSIDTSYGAGGTLYTPGVVETDMATNDNDGFSALAFAPDGRVVAAGTAGGGSVRKLGVARYFGDRPVGVADSYSTDENVELTVNAPGVLGNDLNAGAAPQAVLVQGPANATSFTLNADGSFDYVPAASYHGTDTFTYQAVNGALTSAPITVSIVVRPAATLTLSAGNYPVHESDGTATITVRRLFNSTGPVSVQYATSDGTATAPTDYAITSGTISWADGETGDKTITVPLVHDNLSEGNEAFNVTLSAPTGEAVVGLQGTATVTIAKHHPLAMGTTFTDADGDLVTVRMNGPVGTSAFYLTDGSGPISEIDLAGTDPLQSSISIVVKKPKGGTGDGRVGVGEVDLADGSGVRSVSMPTADLVGAGVNFNGYVGTLIVGNVDNGADIRLSGAAPPKGLPTRIVAGVIGDGTDITVAGRLLGSLRATAVGVGSITAPAVGTITVTGRALTKARPAISGDFKSMLTISGAGVLFGAPALKRLKVAGTVSGSTISVGGNVGSVAAGSFIGSRLLAGYTGQDDGSGSFTPGVTVGSFAVTGKTDAFARSYVIASDFKSANLASVKADDGGTKFGFLAHESIKHLSVTNPTFHYVAGGSITQGVQDFEADIV